MRDRRPLAVLTAAVLVAALSACEQLSSALPRIDPAPPSAPAKSGQTESLDLDPVKFKNLAGWNAERHSEILEPFSRSCERIRKQPPDKPFGSAPEMGRVSEWISICEAAATVRPGNDVDAKYFLESRFMPYAVGDRNNRSGLFTGYYEPELRGAWKPDALYREPLYSVPRDLVESDLGSFDAKWKGEQLAGRLVKGRYVPYYDRAEIEGGALKGRQLEIMWVDDAVDAFFLHIQGSGRILLPDGSHVRVGYAGRNGRRYTAIGRELVAMRQMKLKDVTMPAIRDWLQANPVAGLDVMYRNKSFIFFQVLEGDGPVGAQGVVLSPGRSLAVDRRYLPLGMPVWLQTTEPGTKPIVPLRRLMVAQDTGSAIKGVVRGDVFWGHGADAERRAGVMKERGRYYLLLPRRQLPSS